MTVCESVESATTWAGVKTDDWFVGVQIVTEGETVPAVHAPAGWAKTNSNDSNKVPWSPRTKTVEIICRIFIVRLEVSPPARGSEESYSEMLPGKGEDAPLLGNAWSDAGRSCRIPFPCAAVVNHSALRLTEPPGSFYPCLARF